ncbi:Lipase 1 [Frankliniella fusca]|uniref:Lipase 1 n=1 Tax=Frankliniella fusca TaxID=407009 RepID=A0AAE1H3H2_9NEOP|nr:Lipase 1 [Frankliniella fusca]
MGFSKWTLVHLLLGLSISAPSAGQSLLQPLLAPVMDEVLDLPAIAGSVLGGAAPLVGELNPLLQTALLQNNLTQLSSDIFTKLTGLAGVLLKPVLPVPPILRPDTEAPKFGFNGEAHEVTTSDGYILTFFRVRNTSCSEYLAVVVLPPGILSNAASFIFLKENSLVYKLARQCYDVWLLTFRGYLFGRNHTTLSVNSAQFWDFYPYHWGAYDLPVQLEYVVNKTGSTKLRLMGVDQGGTAFFFMNHVHGPRYQRYVAGCYFWGPIGYLGHLSSLAFAAAALLRDVLTAVGATVLHNELVLFNPAVHSVVYNLCGRVSPLTCFYLFQILSGKSDEINYKLFPYMFANLLDSTSIYTVIYYLQQVGRFKYMAYLDYGKIENLKRYNQSTPVLVNLKATTALCAFYPLGRGTVVVTQDVLDTFRALSPSAQHVFKVLEKYNNVSPLFAIDTEGIYGPPMTQMLADIKQMQG